MKSIFLALALINPLIFLPTAHSTQPSLLKDIYRSHGEIREMRLEPQSLMQIIQEEMVNLDRIAGFKTEVKLTDSDNSKADPDNSISISRSQVEQINRKFGSQQFRLLLRFLLAHEKTHQVQYQLYSVSAVRAQDPERRRLYEAQADILAGKYLMETLGDPAQSEMADLIDILKVAFDLGAIEYSDSDHPSKEERRTAARLGMACGIVATLSGQQPTPALVSMVSSLAEKVDILPGEGVMDWSYRLSKKITHYSRPASLDIVLEDSKIDWDTRASNPFVTFSLTYKNSGKKAIHIDIEVQCASVSREDSDDTLQWMKWSVKNFRFDLLPGQRYVATGRLPWYADKNLMPRLVFPPRDTALMSSEYIK